MESRDSTDSTDLNSHKASELEKQRVSINWEKEKLYLVEQERLLNCSAEEMQQRQVMRQQSVMQSYINELGGKVSEGDNNMR